MKLDFISIGEEVVFYYDGIMAFGTVMLVRLVKDNKWEYFIDPSPGAMHLYESIWLLDGGMQARMVCGHWIHEDNIVDTKQDEER